jgi:hypothetical protein
MGPRRRRLNAEIDHNPRSGKIELVDGLIKKGGTTWLDIQIRSVDSVDVKT